MRVLHIRRTDNLRNIYETENIFRVSTLVIEAQISPNQLHSVEIQRTPEEGLG